MVILPKLSFLVCFFIMFGFCLFVPTLVKDFRPRPFCFQAAVLFPIDDANVYGRQAACQPYFECGGFGFECGGFRRNVNGQ